MVLRLIARSPRCPGFLATVAREIVHGLDPSVGRSGPHAFAVRVRALRLCTPTRPSHPTPNVRDDREAPLLRGQDGAEPTPIWYSDKQKYFSCGGWTRRANQR